MKFILIAFCLLSLSTTLPGQGQPAGLEVADSHKLRVLVEDLEGDATKLGLSSDKIEERVNRILRQNGITPDVGESVTLYVQVNVAENGFSVELSILRPVTFEVGDSTRSVRGVTWRKGLTGSSRSAEFVGNSVDELVRIFCNEFLKANHR